MLELGALPTFEGVFNCQFVKTKFTPEFLELLGGWVYEIDPKEAVFLFRHFADLIEIDPISGEHAISVNAAGNHAFILGFKPHKSADARFRLDE
jgi:hypothetical protein